MLLLARVIDTGHILCSYEVKFNTLNHKRAEFGQIVLFVLFLPNWSCIWLKGKKTKLELKRGGF